MEVVLTQYAIPESDELLSVHSGCLGGLGGGGRRSSSVSDLQSEDGSTLFPFVDMEDGEDALEVMALSFEAGGEQINRYERSNV